MTGKGEPIIFSIENTYALNSMKKLVFFCLLALGAQAQTFTNPLLPSGADPWSVYHDGNYYYMHTTGNSLQLRSTQSITDLKSAAPKTIWKPPVSGPYSKDIWAPEIHFIQGKWYVYFTGNDGKSGDNRRIYVLENSSPDPMQGEWVMKGKLSDESDQWAIDGSVFEYQGKLYLIWSGWNHVSKTDEIQNIYMASLENPWTVGSKRVLISTPELPWERYWDNTTAGKPGRPVYVNEGPQFLKHGNKVFIVYSASGCWTNTYALGLLTAKNGADLLDPKSWKKSQKPVFEQSPENKVYGTGHNSFFKSPDGKEDWFLYHANSGPDEGCGGKRAPRAQKIRWRTDGTPDFGKPMADGVPIKEPSR